MIKTLQNTLRQDKEQFTVPRSVQDTIPIRRIWPDGIFQFGSKFSKCIRFSDINYAIASKEDKAHQREAEEPCLPRRQFRGFHRCGSRAGNPHTGA